MCSVILITRRRAAKKAPQGIKPRLRAVPQLLVTDEMILVWLV
jgi:hypothetical protein